MSLFRSTLAAVLLTALPLACAYAAPQKSGQRAPAQAAHLDAGGERLLLVAPDLARLKAQAAAYDPAAHREQAAAWISETLHGNSEEVTKILGALQRGDDGAALYGLLGIDYNLGLIAALRLGVLFESENRFFEQLIQAAPPEWSRLYRTVMGFGAAGIPQRARAGLGLYRYTCRWLDDLIQPQHREIIACAAGLIPAEWEEKE